MSHLSDGTDPDALTLLAQNFQGTITLFGPRLREQSKQQLLQAQRALATNAGGVLVVRVPPSPNEPIEIRTYPYSVDVQITDHSI